MTLRTVFYKLSCWLRLRRIFYIVYGIIEKRKADREYDMQHAKNAAEAEFLYLREMKQRGNHEA